VANRYEPKLPSLAPDSDQIDAFKNTQVKNRAARVTTASPNQTQTQTDKPTQSSSGFTSFVLLLILLVIGAGGWWFFDQNQRMSAAMESAENRIHDLEQQLSVTGEAMGESTVAMQARLALLGTKTEELWEQMDKLWASAWRKNQADITKIQKQISSSTKSLKQNITTVKSLKNNFSSLTTKMNETEINVGILSEQVQVAETLQSQLRSIKKEISSFKSKALAIDQRQITVASSVTQNEETINDLLNRLKQLEKKISSDETVIKEFQN